VSVGDTQSVVVHADDNLLAKITTTVKAGELLIGSAPGPYTTKSPSSVEVTVPSLDSVTLSGSGIIDVSGIYAPTLSVRLPGSGVLRAEGRTTSLNARLDGSGDVQLQGLVAKDVHAVVSGSGRILVTATRNIDATVSGNGAIVYGGNPPQVTTHMTGSGAITPSITPSG
jgi:hypothetical protein